MKKKTIGFLVCMLTFSMLISASGAININVKQMSLSQTEKVFIDMEKYLDNPSRGHPDFSIFFVNDYCGDGSDLWLCDDDAFTITGRLTGGDAGCEWDLNYWKSSHSADATYWHAGNENTYIDVNDLVVFRGHCSSCYDSFWNKNLNGPLFRCDASDSCLTPGEAYDCYGDFDLEWIALGCCAALSDASMGYWAATMDGLHLILAYKTGASHVTYGSSWIRYCTSIGWWDPPHRIGYSWFKACNTKQGTGKVARIVGEHWNMIYDYLWCEGDVQPDPVDDTTYYYWTHTKGDGIGVPSKAISEAQEMPLYRVIPKQITTRYVEDIGEIFGMSGEVGDGGNYENSYFMADGSKSLIVSKTEGIDYGDEDKLWQPRETQPDLPSLERAETIATNFLKNNGLLPYDASPGKAIYGDVQGKGEKGSTEIIEEFPTDILVEFQRTLNNDTYPVYGGGSSCLVYIGEEEEVTGVTKIWRDLEQVGTVDIFGVSTAKSLFDQYGPQIAIMGCPCSFDEYEVTDIVLGYYGGGFGENQDYLVPCYLLFTTYYGDCGVVEDILVIPASYDFIKPMVTIITPADGSTYPEGQPFTLSGRATYGSPPYTYSWYSDQDGFLGSGSYIYASNLSAIIKDGRNVGHTITLKAVDSKGQVGSTRITVEITSSNQPPKQPSIKGTADGKPGTKYEYVAETTDPEGDDIYYKIFVMDDEESEPGPWDGPHASGTPISFTYSWANEGSYTIMVQAKDSSEAESSWGTLEVTIPRNKPFNTNFKLLDWLIERLPILRIILRLQ